MASRSPQKHLNWEHHHSILNEPVIPVLQSSTAGRPRYVIPWGIVMVYRQSGFTWKQISDLMRISDDTLYRRRKEENIEDPLPYTAITDAELDPLVKNILQQTASVVGVGYIISILSTMAFRIQRFRVRESVARADPIGNFDRWGATIPRIVYSVPAPNYLWHMDGNLKLSQYSLVLHSAIDGYSRYIIYLEVNINNRASIVYESFLRGVQRVQQILLRIRSDKRGENRDVALWMLRKWGVESCCFITGQSVHNQRIERLWREVNRWLTSFRLIFHYLIQQDMYNPNDPVDKFTLILVYLPLVRRMLEVFIRTWNHHKIRTAHHQTPTQLYLMLPEHLQTIERERNRNIDLATGMYGVDWDGPVPREDLDEEGGVVVEPPKISIQPRDLRELNEMYDERLEQIFQENQLDWTLSRYNYGLDMYQEIRNWIRDHLVEE